VSRLSLKDVGRRSPTARDLTFPFLLGTKEDSGLELAKRENPCARALFVSSFVSREGKAPLKNASLETTVLVSARFRVQFFIHDSSPGINIDRKFKETPLAKKRKLLGAALFPIARY